MGMFGWFGERWAKANDLYMASQQRASDVAGGLGAIARVLRMGLQSAVLGLGAYLVIEQQATAGIIIAGSILSARALAPLDFAIPHWRLLRTMATLACVSVASRRKSASGALPSARSH